METSYLDKVLTVQFVRSAALPLWRIKHDAELPATLRAKVVFRRALDLLRHGIIWRPNLPEVWPLNDEHAPIWKDWQLLIAYGLNPGMTGNHYRSLLAYNRAFTNGSGYDNPNGDVRADFVNHMNEDAKVPTYSKTYSCGGATHTGTKDGADLIVSVLNSYAAPPSIEWFKAHPEMRFHAVTNTANGINPFPQMDGLPVIMPLAGSGEARISLEVLERVDFICDPYQYGSVPSPYI